MVRIGQDLVAEVQSIQPEADAETDVGGWDWSAMIRSLFLPPQLQVHSRHVHHVIADREFLDRVFDEF